VNKREVNKRKEKKNVFISDLFPWVSATGPIQQDTNPQPNMKMEMKLKLKQEFEKAEKNKKKASTNQSSKQIQY